MRHQLTFIDLFAGLGGFHIALEELGCKCVFASEIREDLRKLYKINFGMEACGDITQIDYKTIPHHDILCAGFPCQPFSQAGYRQGFDDEKGRGNLFYEICKIIDAQGNKKPRYLLLENVSNLKGHDHGNTWTTIKAMLDERGYEVASEILSPHQFGIPQHRKRIYIVAERKDMKGLEGFSFPEPTNDECDIKTFIDEQDIDITPLKLETHLQLKLWQEFIDNTINNNCPIPTFPIWSMEFGADYPYENCAPAYNSLSNLKGKHGKLGKIVKGKTIEECLKDLPIYSQTAKTHVFPKWKNRYIEENRLFYRINKNWLDKWLEKVKNFSNSHLKFEWNCGENAKPTIFDKIVQFRASGIRVKTATFSPALNLVGTQVPILPWIKLPKVVFDHMDLSRINEFGLTKEDVRYGRYLSTKEAAKLQGMEKLKFKGDDFSLSNTRIYEALGNAVNTQVVYQVAKKLLKE